MTMRVQPPSSGKVEQTSKTVRMTPLRNTTNVKWSSSAGFNTARAAATEAECGTTAPPTQVHPGARLHTS